LDDTAPADITDQVTQYFKLAPKEGPKEDAIVKVEPAKETEVSPVSLAHE
jgi:hypothetical protein